MKILIVLFILFAFSSCSKNKKSAPVKDITPINKIDTGYKGLFNTTETIAEIQVSQTESIKISGNNCTALKCNIKGVLFRKDKEVSTLKDLITIDRLPLIGTTPGIVILERKSTSQFMTSLDSGIDENLYQFKNIKFNENHYGFVIVHSYRDLTDSNVTLYRFFQVIEDEIRFLEKISGNGEWAFSTLVKRKFDNADGVLILIYDHDSENPLSLERGSVYFWDDEKFVNYSLEFNLPRLTESSRDKILCYLENKTGCHKI